MKREQLSDAISKGLRDKGENISDLARQLGFAVQTVHTWMSRNVFPREHLPNIAAQARLRERTLEQLEERYDFETLQRRGWAKRVADDSAELGGPFAAQLDTLKAGHSLFLALGGVAVPREWELVRSDRDLCMALVGALERGLELTYLTNVTPTDSKSVPGASGELMSEAELHGRWNRFAIFMDSAGAAPRRLRLIGVSNLPLFLAGTCVELLVEDTRAVSAHARSGAEDSTPPRELPHSVAAAMFSLLREQSRSPAIREVRPPDADIPGALSP